MDSKEGWSAPLSPQNIQVFKLAVSWCSDYSHEDWRSSKLVENRGDLTQSELTMMFCCMKIHFEIPYCMGKEGRHEYKQGGNDHCKTKLGRDWDGHITHAAGLRKSLFLWYLLPLLDGESFFDSDKEYLCSQFPSIKTSLRLMSTEYFPNPHLLLYLC